MYRLMQLSQTTIPMAADYTHLFSHQRKTNRVEFVTDFPTGDDAEVVSSLQIHPQGWCALSRNISNDENSEASLICSSCSSISLKPCLGYQLSVRSFCQYLQADAGLITWNRL